VQDAVGNFASKPAAAGDADTVGALRPDRIMGKADTGAVDAAQAMVDYAKETRTVPSGKGPAAVALEVAASASSRPWTSCRAR
jgi:hypothetical protein